MEENSLIESWTTNELKTYFGRDSAPSDFIEFWKKQLLNEVTGVSPEYQLMEKEFGLIGVSCHELKMISFDGSEIYSKLLFPKQDTPCPVVFKFHGYQGRSADWSDCLKYTSQGIGVVMMDVRGQAGKSSDAGQYKGNTVKGHIIRGLEEGPDNLFYRHVYLDIVMLIQLIKGFKQVDETKLISYGESQGGALALVAAALVPEIQKSVIVYPFLSDFRRVLDIDIQTDAYSELFRYFKYQDPLCETKNAALRTLSYIDVKNFASMVQADTVFVASMKDDVCPPSTQFAVYNQLTCNKTLYALAEYGHEALNVCVGDKLFSFLTETKIHE